MMPSRFEDCFSARRFILTEGAVGQRVEREFGLRPDPDIMYAALIYNPAGREALSAIYRSYLQIAEAHHLPLLLMANTRRANKDRVLRSKYRDKNIMRDYAAFLRELATAYTCETYIGGIVGCRGDAYSGAEGISTEEAAIFHAWQMEQCAGADFDFLFAGIMPALPEALGMAQVMEQSGWPYIISLMISQRGTLLDGTAIHDAIAVIDGATRRHPLCYMTNCVHPNILREALSQEPNRTALVRERFRGIQANAACLLPEELDSSQALQTTSAEELGEAFALLHGEFPLKIYGGCCGTDDSHMRELVRRLE